MRIKNCGGNHDSELVLGVQTNVGSTDREADNKARAWAPKRAKSYTIYGFEHTDYHGRRVSKETGYATIVVHYFTTKTEGQRKL